MIAAALLSPRCLRAAAAPLATVWHSRALRSVPTCARRLGLHALAPSAGIPDPDGQSGFVIHANPGTDLAPSAAAFQAGLKACRWMPSSLTPAQEDQAFQRALNAAAWMQAHGVPNYPEPKLINATIKLSFTASVNPTTSAVQAAAKKCGYQNELQAEETRSRIAFVRCMRILGVRSFPLSERGAVACGSRWSRPGASTRSHQQSCGS